MAPGVPVGVRSLRRFLVAGQRQALPEACQLCATPVPQRHPHLVHVLDRRLLCACWACALLFEYGGPERPGAAGGYRRVPDRYLSDPGFRLTDAQWEQLQIPVGLAFFLRNSARDQVIACYPGPAGATESELGLPAWSGGLGAGRLAAELEPDVEALLVRRDRAGGGGNGECLLVPVDACYRLAGLVRRHWRGFDGGSEAWQAIEACFQELRELARPLPPAGTGV